MSLDTAWEEVERLIRVNARHRKGFRLSEIPDDRFVVSQARDEFDEMSQAFDENGANADVELCDLLGVLFHLAIRRGMTPHRVCGIMLEKLAMRFTESRSDVPFDK